MSNFYMDAHMNFDLYKNSDLILDEIERNHSYTIAMTNLPELYERYHLKYQGFKYIRIALGLHPELAFQYKYQIDTFRRLVNSTRFIGEIGLDFTTQDKENRKAQIEVFSAIISMCKSPKKILSVHSRRAEKECIEIMGDFPGKVILHWYSGSMYILKNAVERGYYFSINHQMILTNNGRKIINQIPMSQILIESDAPFTNGLSAKYSLSFMKEIYLYLSSSKGLSFSDTQYAIKNNLRRVLT